MEAGLKTTTVKEILAELPKVKLAGKRKASVMQVLLQYDVPATIEIGDGTYVCFSVNEWTSGWKVPGSRKKVPLAYEPYVEIRIDVGRIRRDVLHESAEE